MRALHWFRNDLRLRDNTALAEMAARADAWLPVFVWDPRLVGDGSTPRVRFLLDCLRRLAHSLAERDVPLLVRSGRPERVLAKLTDETKATLVSFNADTTPFAKQRDTAVREALEKRGVEVAACVDRVIRVAADVRTGSGGPYSVYTPYRTKWWKLWRDDPRPPQRVPRLPAAIPGFAREARRALADLPESQTDFDLPTGGEAAARRRLDRFLEASAADYARDRDRPEVDGTSRLSPYLRFGAISIRECFDRAGTAMAADERLEKGLGKWLDELIWREFYAAILEEHPRVLRGSYRREYDRLEWNDDPEGFAAWCEGRTGYPIVDAGMRQLRASGWMHNRVRMIVASFLTKDLLIDWRAGERFFFERLVDGDPASNNGGWQWAASTGTDAQPYFRIFNPVSQGERWDPQGRYVRRWLPELRDVEDRYVHAPWQGSLPRGYPPPIVDHAERRETALARFRSARRK